TRSPTSTRIAVTRPPVCADSSVCRSAPTTPSQSRVWPSAAASTVSVSSVVAARDAGASGAEPQAASESRLASASALTVDRLSGRTFGSPRRTASVTDAQALHHHAGRAEAAETVLEQVEADERREQPEPRRHELRQHHAEQHHDAGEANDSTFDTHVESPDVVWKTGFCGCSMILRGFLGLQALDAQRLHHVLLVDRLGGAAAHLV